MLAHATSSTAPTVPMSTHSMPATPPTTSSFNGLHRGRDPPTDHLLRGNPGRAGHASSQIGSSRARSAFASASVTPGLSRAMPGAFKWPNTSGWLESLPRRADDVRRQARGSESPPA